MVNDFLINPKSIVIVGGSNDTAKPGGKVLKNIIEGGYKGKLFVTNLKEDKVQGVKSYRDPADLPDVDLAILAIAARFCPSVVDILARQKNTKAFIILSAGFSEENEEGASYEKKIVDIINDVNGCLIGPNCIGVINQKYSGAFTTPIPKLDTKGCDFISGSGATAVFIMEAGISKGLTFASVYSVGNSSQLGVENIVKYLDESYDPDTSSRVKLLYFESITKPGLLLKHASSLINKGCKIAAIKAGSSEAGSRAASSHTGAMASSDVAVDALFRKAGIIRCYGREELTTIASIFMHKELKGKRVAIITHAGGPAVMLTDCLEHGGLEIPKISGPASKELLEKLYPGSSVSNPIDFLATGNSEQLAEILDYCENRFDNIDAMVLIFGSSGLFPVNDVYSVLHERMKYFKKPIYPALPSIINAGEEIKEFLSKGRINFPDEVLLGQGLVKVFNTPEPAPSEITFPELDKNKIRDVINNAQNGYLAPGETRQLLSAAGVPTAEEAVVETREEAVSESEKLDFPVVMKVVGPVHKSDVKGVVLDIKDKESLLSEFDQMIQIKDTTAVLIQPMLSGTELFIGAKYEENFGHMVLCGLGGIFVEVLKDVSAGLVPVGREEVLWMIRNLKGYGIIKGVRGIEGIDEEYFADIVVRVSALVYTAPEIIEMDINPLLGRAGSIIAVDSRIRIEHK